jgi:hypothetical protein
MIKKKKQTKLGKFAMTLAKAVVSPDSPACEVISNPWLLKDIINLAFEKPKIKFIMVSGGYGENMTEIYSISTNTWINGPELPQVRFGCGMALVDIDDGDGLNYRELFNIGGQVGDAGASRSIVSLKISTTGDIDSNTVKAMEWKMISGLKMRRSGPGVGVVDGKKIFVIGGWNGMEYFKTIEVFSVEEGKWIDSSDGHVPLDMPTGRSGMRIAVIGKKIFVIGGFNLIDGYLSTVEVLDTETNKWSTLPSMKIARDGMGIAVIDDRFIWILGGFNGSKLDSIEIFDVEKNEWTASTVKLTLVGIGMNAIAVNHKIFVIGGRQGNSGISNGVEVLDIDDMKLTTLSSMKYCHLGACVVGF